MRMLMKKSCLLIGDDSRLHSESNMRRKEDDSFNFVLRISDANNTVSQTCKSRWMTLLWLITHIVSGGYPASTCAVDAEVKAQFRYISGK
jgi:hypothetical protein